MLKRYWTLALRRIQKHSLYTFVNLFGLTLGIACCLLIGLYIFNEVTYDKFHVQASHIMRITMSYGDGGKQKAAVTGTKAGPQIKRRFPQVASFVRLINKTRVVKNGDHVFTEKRFLFVDSSFFQIFSFPLLKGDPINALKEPRSVVLSQSMAAKYFGQADPVGKVLKINDKEDYVIRGIVKDAPENSQIKYDFIASFNSLEASQTEEWWTANYFTYLLLNKHVALNEFQEKLNQYMAKVSSSELHLGANSPLLYHLEPMLSVHLSSDLDGLEPNGNKKLVTVLGIIAVLILIIACINYTNLTTAQASSRIAEIGIRKLLGAKRSELFGQFLGESFILSVVSMLLALTLAYVFLPLSNQLIGKHLDFWFLFQIHPFLILVLLVFSISMVAGGYPAFILSNYKVISVIKSGFRIISAKGKLGEYLIIFQFLISVALIICTIIVTQQIKYIKNKDIGYDREHILVLPINKNISQNYETFKTRLSSLPDVVSVSSANATPSFVQWSDVINGDLGKGKVEVNVKALPSDLGFIKTMGIKLIAGSDFTRADFPDTSSNNKNFMYSFILNQSAVKELGLTSSDAIGKIIYKNKIPGEIKGVVQDFNFASLHEPVGPLLLFLDRDFANYFLVRIQGAHISETISSLETLWREQVPSMPFEYHFLDDEFNNMYASEQRTSELFSVFSILAIILSCMGLFALAAISILQRTREIGIRKVLGASVVTILSLVVKNYLRLTIIGILLASPIAWYFMNLWLMNFAYRISIHWWIFVLAGGVAIFITLITILFHSLKVAYTNPAKSLKAE